jgi:MFS transporter, ACS family, D-galactonate transporter
VALIILGSLVGLATVNILVILQGCAPPGEVGVWPGAENFDGNLARVLAPLVTGLLISVTGSYCPAFALGALILLAGVLSYWLVVGEMRHSTTEK